MRNNTLDPSIFRAYDIRGIVDETLKESDVLLLGRVLGSWVLEKGDQRLILGRDGRLSSPRLAAAFCQGVRSTGCDVVDVGLVPTPLVYYATHRLRTQSGVMVTGSHNPGSYNGLKIVMAGKPLSQEEIQDLYQRAIHHRYVEGQGMIDEMDITDRYIEEVRQRIRPTRSLKIVVDAGNGAAGNLAPLLYRRLGHEVIPLYCDVDGHFPNHHPDPSETKNLADLVQAVKHHSADIGLAFDGDGDRLGVVTARGDIIFADRLIMLFAKDLLATYPDATIIYDVKCSNHLGELILAAGGKPIMWKTGHSLMKAKLLETQALLAGEMSGHLFFKERWFGFDDGLYAGARLLEILGQHPHDVLTLFDELPNSVNTPELKIAVPDHEKFSLMQELAAHMNFVDAEVFTLDGLRVSFKEGWGLIRPSNTSPYLILRFEAVSERILQNIQTMFREVLLTVKPGLVLPF